MIATSGPSPSTAGVWEEHGERLQRFILRHVSNAADADDILQETFLKVHKGLPSLKRQERLTSWVYQIARNTIADYHRRPRARALTEGLAERLEDDALSELGGFHVFEETAHCLRPMVRRLPARYRRAIDLVESQGLAQNEVAERLGISLSGAKSRVQRARGKLKDMLQACCRFEFDRRGHIVDFQPNSGAKLCASGDANGC
jgi:RNA polymerase sigma-70 factor (ECF subfamily)